MASKQQIQCNFSFVGEGCLLNKAKNFGQVEKCANRKIQKAFRAE